MPSLSKSQNRLMHAAAAGDSDKVPVSVGKEFIAADKGTKVSSLPERRKKLGLRTGRR